MMFVAEDVIQGYPNVHWLGFVCQCFPIPAGIQLSVCIPVLKIKSTDLRFLCVSPQTVDGIVVGYSIECISEGLLHLFEGLSLGCNAENVGISRLTLEDCVNRNLAGERGEWKMRARDGRNGDR